MENYTSHIICPCGSLRRFICLATLIIYNACLYVLLWEINASRIFEEAEFQECLHTRNNIHKLGETPLETHMADCSHLSTKNRQDMISREYHRLEEME